METVLLYPDPPIARIERVSPDRASPAGCTRCALHESAKHPGVGAEGAPGGVLFVGEGPGKEEDLYEDGEQKGRPFWGVSGQYLRRLVSKYLHGVPVAYDNATRCYPSGGANKREIEEKFVDECRPYLADTIRNAQPQRIVALGTVAAYSLLGRTVSPLSIRRGYDWLWNDGKPIPVFLVLHPAAAVRNRFLTEWFEEDFRWAVQTMPRLPPWADLRPSLAGQAGASGSNRVYIVTTPEEARRAAARLREAEWFSWDVETTGVQFTGSFEVISLSCTGLGQQESWEWDGAGLEDPAVRAPLLELLADPRARKVEQNGKYDRISAKLAWQTDVRGLHLDTRLVRRLLDPDADADLDTMGNLVGMGGHKEEAMQYVDEAVSGLRKAAKNLDTPDMFRSDTEKYAEMMVRLGAEPKSFAYGLMPPEVRRRYNARDSVATARVGARLECDMAAEPNIQRVWERVVRRTAEAIPVVEYWGVPISTQRLTVLGNELKFKMELVEKKLQREYQGLNPYSTHEVKKLLYDTLKIPVAKYTAKGNPSVDEEALSGLKGSYPVVADILETRRLKKLDGTYATGLLDHVRDDGRIHGSIDISGARSGRASMSDPNLQNIPTAKSSAEAKAIRDCFLAESGYVLIELDYSQIELRIAAWLSGDAVMTELFNSGMDFHQGTARLIAPIAWGLQPDQVGEEHRRGAKTVNFGLAYGLSNYNLAERLGCTEEKAEQIRNAVFGQFKRFKTWTQECVQQAHSTGYTWTYWEGERARRRSLWRIGDKGNDKIAREQRSHAERVSYNNPVQGTAAEFCMCSLGRCVEDILAGKFPEGTQPVLPIHDSLIFVAKKEHAREVAALGKQVMLDYDTGDVPLDVDIKWGESWGSCEKLKV